MTDAEYLACMHMVSAIYLWATVLVYNSTYTGPRRSSQLLSPCLKLVSGCCWQDGGRVRAWARGGSTLCRGGVANGALHARRLRRHVITAHVSMICYIQFHWFFSWCCCLLCCGLRLTGRILMDVPRTRT